MISRNTTKYESVRDLKDVVKSRKVGHNTFRVWYGDGRIAFRLHFTDVVTYDADWDMYILDVGNWYTPTSKDRINKEIAHLGVQIYQSNWEWFVRKTCMQRDTRTTTVQNFYNKMVLDHKGDVVKHVEFRDFFSNGINYSGKENKIFSVLKSA